MPVATTRNGARAWLVLIRHFRELGKGDVALLFVVGLTGNALPAFLYAKSETVLPTAVVGVLTSMTPIFALIVAWLFFRQRFPISNVVGIVIGLVGAAVLAMAGSPEADRSTNLASRCCGGSCCTSSSRQFMRSASR